ncbi:heavy metal-binding domain-containing protein [Aureibaculum luteum]|uniref:heavy metal-binding domain-containing protein n=1 Tax=Aureibaculum luteum TaxID=1548456 RepID=UPI000E47B4FD|nr:heavy metal-binding domain-containing protein [Aureibaculum luteum]
MKKLILMLAVVTVVSIAFTSCKSDKKEDVKTEEKVDVASNEVYQCPMNCEDGKSYTEAGSCPVCNMALKSKTVDMDGDSHKEHADEDEDDHNDSEEDGDKEA